MSKNRSRKRLRQRRQVSMQMPRTKSGQAGIASDGATQHPPSDLRTDSKAHVAPLDEAFGSATAAGEVIPYDDNLLDACRTRWQLANWKRLAESYTGTLQHHPHRARIALLLAAAHFQLGNTQQAQRLLQLALDWGASRRQAVQMVLSGIHHSLAEAHVHLGHTDKARSHWRQSLKHGGVPGDLELLARLRESNRSNPTDDSMN